MFLMRTSFSLFLLLLAGCCISPTCASRSRTFAIDYKNNQFLKDGKPFRYISGEIHYNRIQPELWRDRLMRLRHAGLNAIQVYVPWNLHETFENQFNFDGMANITEFLRLAQEQDLYVLLRSGPYICAEWENGGLPYWLLKKKDIKLRVYDRQYIAAVENYFNHLLPLVRPLLYQNGGPIIMVQVENEYGSFGCDKKYLAYLRDLIKRHLGNEIVLYTTDGAGEGYLKCGVIDGVFPTVDFGAASDGDVKKYFEIQQKFSKGGPIVNSEFYPGWFTLWGQGLPQLPSTEAVLDTMSSIYNSSASFSFYMFHGGTNFGFWNGAETDGAVITSYDYGAPVSENGGITPRYVAIQNWINELPDWDHKPLATPRNNTVRAYGNVTMQRVQTLLESFVNSAPKCIRSELPLSFEDIDHPYGFVMYRKILDFDGTNLTAANVKDHGYVFVNELAQGVLIDNLGKYSKKWLSLPRAKKGDILTIIVENRGRKTYLTEIDRKGLLPNVTLDGYVLMNWTQCAIDLGPTSPLINMKPSAALAGFLRSTLRADSEPDAHLDTAGVYIGSFTIDGEIADTWFDPGHFRKGQVIINGVNLGRYWPSAGPQITLYVPAPVLKRKNSVVLIELLGRRPASSIAFVEAPKYQPKLWKHFRRSSGGRHP